MLHINNFKIVIKYIMNRDQIIDKIVTANPGVYVIFYSPACGYSINAIDLLRESDSYFKAYDIDNIRGGLNRVLSSLSNQANRVGFDIRHRTKPIIFIDGKFIGGHNELQQHIGQSKINNPVPYNRHDRHSRYNRR